jgi:hypothetical protein
MVRSLYPYHQAARTRCSSIPLVAFLGKFFRDSRRCVGRVGQASGSVRRPATTGCQVTRSGDRPQRAMQSGHHASGERAQRGTFDSHWTGRWEPALRSLCLASEEERVTVVRPGAASIGAERSEEKNSFERGCFGWRRLPEGRRLWGSSAWAWQDRAIGGGIPSRIGWPLRGIVRPGAECY